VHPFPPTPSLADAPADRFEQGHLWLQEWVVGAPLRFRLDEAGLIFGDADRIFDAWDEPTGYGHAVRWVRSRFDEEAFRAEVDATGEYTFLGIATRNEGINYDWDSLPGFLGVDIYDPDGEVPPDIAERAFERLGLDSLNTFKKEVPARDFRPDRHEVPESAWCDGPAAGTLVRNKRGERAVIHNPAVERETPESIDAATLVDRELSPERIDRVASELGEQASVDAVLDRLVETLARRHYAALDDSVDGAAIRSAAAEPVARRLG
jgi:hypothetical protein